MIQSSGRARKRVPAMFVMSDFEGLFGQLLGAAQPRPTPGDTQNTCATRTRARTRRTHARPCAIPATGTSIQFMLFEKIMTASCGFSAQMLAQELMPGAASVYLLGHFFFALQASRLTRKSKNPVTALPQGINIVTFFAFTQARPPPPSMFARVVCPGAPAEPVQPRRSRLPVPTACSCSSRGLPSRRGRQLIMAPEYALAIGGGASDVEAARLSYDAGIASCFLLGCLELLGVPFVNQLRQMIPRAAMLAAIAGVSLTFIAMGFAVQIWAAPGTAMVSMLLMLIFYAGNVKLPLRIPGGLVAVLVGTFLAAASSGLGYEWFTPSPLHYSGELHLPTLQSSFVSTLLRPSFYRHLSVIVPMLLVNLVNNLANIEAASAVGDNYDAQARRPCTPALRSPPPLDSRTPLLSWAPCLLVQTCLLATALLDLGCALLGNPFPSCVYIGHSAFKAMGCRVGYLYLNMVGTSSRVIPPHLACRWR